MVAITWTAGLLRRRRVRVLGASAGVALAVGLLASLGAFVATAKAQMTRRAVRQVPVDWQVEVQPGASPDDVLGAIRSRQDVVKALPVGFGTASGFQATTGGTIQSTGPGLVMGLPPGYRSAFPAEVRSLAGGTEGVLVAQQTAANLHAGPGDTVTIARQGLPPERVRVDGVVDLAAADSLFQRVGAPPGSQPQAPPDNVVLLPAAQWHSLFDVIGDGAQPARTQIHVRLDHRLPNDPAAAFSRASGAARRLEADLAGAALVGDNLGATLDAARSDALYAQVLFILLGLPGAFLAGLLTRSVAAVSRDARRRELSLLRTRGASLAQLQRVVAVEAATVAVLGAASGLVLGAFVGRAAFGSATFGATSASAVVWVLGSVATGLIVAIFAVAVPARHDATAATVASARRSVGQTRTPLALRYGLDIAILACAAVVFAAASRGHYNLVLAPEGVATVAVSYWELAGPLLAWVGIGLLSWRVAETLLGRGGRFLRAILRPIAGGLRGPAASALRRQRRSMATGVVLVTLTATFAISTAVFNTTYLHQVQADALLTNGAPVTVTELAGSGATAAESARFERVPGVGHVEAIQHRFVYVGSDLQDLYGVDPATIGAAGQLQDAYFAGGGAKELLARMAREPDSALVSAETVQDFQLQPGDRLRLRVRDARSGQLVEVVFRFAGVVREFPTAPTDSFVVANAGYIARKTGDASVSTFLVSTHGASPGAVAGRLRPVAGPGATVTDIDASRRVIGSSLTAVDLAGLTRVELAYALVLVVAATGLVLGLGLNERRRTLAIVTALGARGGQRGVFARAEATVFALLGGVLGIAGGWTLAHMLVKVLTGVFDPPPSALSVPWRYLAVVALCGAAGLVGAVVVQVRATRRPVIEMVRDL